MYCNFSISVYQKEYKVRLHEIADAIEVNTYRCIGSPFLKSVPDPEKEFQTKRTNICRKHI